MEAGNASAQFGLAEMCIKGEGGDRNYAEAYLFASLAAAQDFPKAAKLRDKAARKLGADELAAAKQRVLAATSAGS